MIFALFASDGLVGISNQVKVEIGYASFLGELVIETR